MSEKEGCMYDKTDGLALYGTEICDMIYADYRRRE